MANDRTDLKVDLLGSEVELTGKVMPNGETRRRVRMGDVTLHVTTTVVGGWQEAHYHKGLRETYTVITGRMALAFEDPDDDSQRAVMTLEPAESVVTDTRCSHNVYLYPNTTIVTAVYGEPVANPDKNGNDWWPIQDDFDSWSKGLSEADISRLAED